jgi:hypothetical protein
MAARAFGDDRLIVNMSVWETIEDLAAFVYRDVEHRAVLRRRREWFRQMREAHHVLWWVPSGHRPTVAEAEHRLRLLREDGPTEAAFTVSAPFPAPGAPSISADRDWYCRS